MTKKFSPSILSVNTATQKLKKKSKKKRKPLYPKSYNPDGENAPIDPERWTPLRERTYYKGKRRDKKGKIGKGNQGTAGQEKLTEALDMSKKTSVQRNVKKKSQFFDINVEITCSAVKNSNFKICGFVKNRKKSQAKKKL